MVEGTDCAGLASENFTIACSHVACKVPCNARCRANWWAAQSTHHRAGISHLFTQPIHFAIAQSRQLRALGSIFTTLRGGGSGRGGSGGSRTGASGSGGSGSDSSCSDRGADSTHHWT